MIPALEPEEIDEPRRSPSVDPRRLALDVAEITALIQVGIEVDGETQVAESLWAIYGHTTYDSGIVVAEYTDVLEATAVLRAVPHGRPGTDGADP